MISVLLRFMAGRWLVIAGWAGFVSMFGLWIDARENTIEAQAACNMEQVEAALDAERAARIAERESHQQTVNNLASRYRRMREAIRVSQEAARKLQAGVDWRDKAIEELRNDSISGKCLNAPVPVGVLYPESCDADENSTGAEGSDHGACTGGANEANTADSDITYSDAMKIWHRDRAIIDQHNADKKAIEGLQ